MNEEMIEDFVLGMARIIREKQRLEDENYMLKEEIKGYRQDINERLKESQNQVASIFNTISNNMLNNMERTNQKVSVGEKVKVESIRLSDLNGNIGVIIHADEFNSYPIKLKLSNGEIIDVMKDEIVKM